MSTPKELAVKLRLLGNEQGAVVHAADAVDNSEAVSGGDILLVPSRSATQLSINQDFNSEASQPKTSRDAEQQGDYDYRALADDDADVLAAPDAKERQEKLSEPVQVALLALGIQEKELGDLGIDLKSLNELISKELSCTHYFRWAAVDNIIEKLIQRLVISKEDLKPAKQLCFPLLKQLARHMPHGRSIPLQQDWGIKKVQASRSIIQTTEQILINGVRLFIAVALSYRLYELTVKGSSDFSEFSGVFEANSQKGISGLVHALAKVDKTWLQLLLASPAIIGSIKGLWDGYQTGALNSLDLIKIQTAVQEHTQPLRGIKQKLFSYLWQDTLYQLISIPLVTTVSEYCQKAERSIRWDGRITLAQRAELFNHIQQLALRGHSLSKITAMQSMAKIAHSFSIQDFAVLQKAGHNKETLVQLLKIKAVALQNIRKMIKQSDSHSIPTLIYAHYLLWWLGMGSIKNTVIFLSYKAFTLSLEILFIKEIIDSILEAIRCPDKPGFRMFYGDYEIWANDLTPDCFREFVRQFRLISKKETFQPFLEQLQNFHLRDIDTVDLSNKALTSNETQAILEILNLKMQLKYLDLSNNLIDEMEHLVFHHGLLKLNLEFNRITSKNAGKLVLPRELLELNLYGNQIGSGAKELSLPQSLLSLSLRSNQIGPQDIQGLFLPQNLQILNLGLNHIGDGGTKALSLPQSLLSLNLERNRIGFEGVKALSLPKSLQILNLEINHIGNDGFKVLSLPQSLQSLILAGNGISDEGTKGLFLPSGLQLLNLGSNRIGSEGAKELILPQNLQVLNLGINHMGNDGIKALSLPQSLQSLILVNNEISDEGIKGLSLPPRLQSLNLGGNQIGDSGIKELFLPYSLQSLNLAENLISDAGAKKLSLPQSLQSVDLGENQISDDGAQGLTLPQSLQSLDLKFNQIGPKGAKALSLPQNLQSLNLLGNHIGNEGAKELILPSGLQSLNLGGNQIGPEGAKELSLPSSLRLLDLRGNRIGDDGVKVLSLPQNLQSLNLYDNQIGSEGAKGLTLPSSLQSLDLLSNQISDDGAQGLTLPQSLQFLDLGYNLISDNGVKAILVKISHTQLVTISLEGNKYNISALNADRIVQQQILLRYCKDKLCHANTPLQPDDPFQAKLQKQQGKQSKKNEAQQKLLQNQLPQDHLTQLNPELQISGTEEPQTSGAPYKTPCLFFSWLKKPLQSLKDQADACVTSTIDSISARLRNVLSDCPSYFPNIHSPVLHDFHPPGPLMLSQFKPDYALTNVSSVNSLPSLPILPALDV